MGRGVQLLFSSLKFILGHDTSGEEPLRADYKRINADASLVLVGIYLAACLLGVGWGFYVFVVRPFKFYQFVLFVISLWILQVVLKFWRYLSAVDPARARVLASPRRRHAASQAAHNERAVRRLESGASSGES